MAVEGDSSVFQTRVVKYFFSVLANKAMALCSQIIQLQEKQLF